MKSSDLAEVRRTLWAAADQLRANSTLLPSEYRGPVLGLIFLAYASRAVRQGALAGLIGGVALLQRTVWARRGRGL